MGVTPGQKGLGGWILRWDDPERRQQQRDDPGQADAARRDRADRAARGEQLDLERAQADWADRVDRAALPWWRRLLGRRAR